MRRGRILILLGLILAIGTAAAVYVVVNSMEPTQTAEIELEPVVVALQPIPEEEPVEGRIGLVDMPKNYVPQGALRSLDDTSGLLAAGPIPQGAVIHPDMLISPEELAQEGELGKLVEPGLVAVAFPISELSSVSYGIRPGDHIDVLMTFFFMDIDQDTQITEPICAPYCSGPEGETEAALGAQIPRPAAQLTLQNIRVIGVGRWAQELTPEQEQAQADGGEPVPVELPRFITVLVTPQDALVLKLAREMEAKIELAVRSEEDAQVFTTQQVTLDYILARFGVTLPTKQPYTLESLTASPAASE
ncbi:MAG: Flp pilus assembly protein CpaB [Anaerolineae bacterium]|jgi:pilus assembly protein CpaB